MKAVMCLGFALTVAACASIVYPTGGTEKDLAVQLTFGDGGLCSGTPVARNTLLTAAHCLDKDGDGRADPEFYTSIIVDGEPTVIVEILDDGNDHALIVTEMKYRRHADFGLLPKVGDQVHLYGNPGGIEDLYRQGAYIGWAEGMYLFDMNIWHGDSGSAILNAQGQIVGVTTGYIIDHNPMSGAQFRICVALPFAFTAEQWEKAGIDTPQPAVLQLDV